MAEKKKGEESRKWQLTINNPIDHGCTHEAIASIIQEWSPIVYWCIGDEIGENGTYHSHIFLSSSSAVRFTTVKKKFPMAHIEYCNGTCKENRDYCFKDGDKFNKKENGEYDYKDEAGKRHHGTHYDTTNEEYGVMPIERQGARTDLSVLYSMIKDGKSNYEILEECPQYIDKIDRIDKVRQTVIEEKFKDTWRNLEVTYIWGRTNSGKTRSVMDAYGYSNVYRVTDYCHPFDAYKGQDIIVFEEFRSDIRLGDMLVYLDGYPVELPCRYNNKQACFTKVFIITNIDLRDQYPHKQKDEPTTWQAFLRRIHHVKVYTGEKVVEYDTQTYLKEGWHFFKKTPFDDDEEEKENV